MWIHGLRSGGPASSSSTRYLPDSLSRAATGQPAEPAPVTIKSKVSAAPVTICPWVRINLPRPTLANAGGIGKAANQPSPAPREREGPAPKAWEGEGLSGG